MPTAECDLDGLLKNSRKAKVDRHGLARYSETPLYSVGPTPAGWKPAVRSPPLAACRHSGAFLRRVRRGCECASAVTPGKPEAVTRKVSLSVLTRGWKGFFYWLSEPKTTQGGNP